MDCKMQVIIEQFEPYHERCPLWSILFVKIDEVCFPGKHWRDATSSVLSIWLDNIDKLLSGMTKSVYLPFMDGDYSLELTWQSQNQASVRFRGSNNIIMLEQEIDLQYFGRQILSAVGKMKKEYAAHLETYQLRELSKLAEKLRVTLKNVARK